jgi:replicative DNA helicase
MGKTAFALSIARYAAVVNQIPTVFFSLEMSAMQLVTRLLCAEANLDSRRVQNADLSPEEWELLLRASRVLAQAPLFIDDTAALSIYELRAKARRLRAEKRIELVIVDYLQLMRGMVSKNINREQEVATISRSLKELAKELEIPVIALAQLNRAVETRQNKKPLLSDLRESGSIEQDADLILFIDRPERYGVLTYEDGTPTEGMATVIIGKHRNGPTGEVRLRFVKEYGKFLNETDVAPTPPSEITAFYPTHQKYSEISIPSRASEILSASLEEEDTADSDEEDFFPF